MATAFKVKEKLDPNKWATTNKTENKNVNVFLLSDLRKEKEKRKVVSEQ